MPAPSYPAALSTSATGVRSDAEARLQALVGSSDARLREEQWSAIAALVRERRRVLVVQRTGWGKSAVYFVATALLRARGAGPTIIISPLLALMRNQIAAAERAGIHAVTINSANREDWAEVYRAIRAGRVDVLLVSPERLNNPEFRDEVLPHLAAAAGLVVVDEAHCISDWGHDFRPDYRRIRSVLADLPPGIPVLATTATANSRVARDVAEQLSVTGTGALDEVLVLRGSLDRESLHLGVLSVRGQAQRLAWLADHLHDLPGSGIIYCLTVAATQVVAEHLRAAGHEVRAYSGQTDAAEREQIEAELLANRIKAVVGTSALGMGFDKPDLGFVVHVGAPNSPIAYYQQVGRAGRATESATVLLLPGEDDQAIWRYFAEQAFPAPADVRATLDALTGHGTLSTAALETFVGLRRARLEAMLKVLDVDGAVRRVKGGWQATGQRWVHDTERYARVDAARAAEARLMLDYIATDTCRLQFLRQALDDPDAAPCGRCDSCGGLTIDATVRSDTIAAAADRLARPGTPIVPKTLWPSGLHVYGLKEKGRIAADQAAAPGRAIGRLTDIGWGSPLRGLLDPPARDGDLPAVLAAALRDVLDSWEFPDARPLVAVAVPSVTRPTLVAATAHVAADHLGIPVLPALALTGTGAPASGPTNSAHRLRQVLGRHRPTMPLTGMPVLLVDDLVDTGWTMTLLARLLRQAGAATVHPLALATVT